MRPSRCVNIRILHTKSTIPDLIAPQSWTKCTSRHPLTHHHEAATPRSPQYFATSFFNVSCWWLTVSMISLTPWTEEQYADAAIIWARTACSWFGNHCSQPISIRTAHIHNNTHSNNWTASRRRGMRCALQNVLACEAPVPPAEITDLIERLEVQGR